MLFVFAPPSSRGYPGRPSSRHPCHQPWSAMTVSGLMPGNELGLELHGAMRGFDDHPVPFFYPPFPCRIGMHLNRREGKNLTQRGHVPQPARIIHLGCVKIGENERIGFQQLRRGRRALRRLVPAGQGAETLFLEGRVVDRHLTLREKRLFRKQGGSGVEKTLSYFS